MTRYFLDTGVLVGLTFLHDLWRDEAERLFETDNTLYTTRAVLYEYCNSTKTNLLEDAEVDWETEEGLFGDKLSKVRVAQMNLDLKLRTYDDNELDLETLVDDFISETGVEDAIYEEEMIDKRIRPNIKTFLKNEIGNREITPSVARETMDVLCDTIQTQARDVREQIRERIREYPEQEIEREKFTQKLHFVDGYLDTIILGDAGYLKENNVLERLISADKSDMYENRERIKAVLGIQVVFIKDEFSNHPVPSKSR